MEKTDEMMLSAEVVEEIEGYDYCDGTAEKCMNDCIGPWAGTPVITHIE